jgi:hypothetical protein
LSPFSFYEDFPAQYICNFKQIVRRGNAPSANRQDAHHINKLKIVRDITKKDCRENPLINMFEGRRVNENYFDIGDAASNLAAEKFNTYITMIRSFVSGTRHYGPEYKDTSSVSSYILGLYFSRVLYRSSYAPVLSDYDMDLIRKKFKFENFEWMLKW